MVAPGKYFTVMVLLVVWTVFALPVIAQELTSPNLVFELGNSARSVGIGGAGGAHSIGVAEAFQHPSALMDVQRSDASATVRSWRGSGDDDLGAEYMNGALALRIGGQSGVIALGLARIQVPDIPQTTESSMFTVGTFEERRTGITAAYARPIVGQQLWIGIGVRYIQHELFGDSADGYGLQISSAWQAHPRLRLVATMGNGGSVTWDSGREEESPACFRTALAWTAREGNGHGTWLMVEPVQENDRPLAMNLGLEQMMKVGKGKAFLRGGVNHLTIEERGYGEFTSDHQGFWSLGFGYESYDLVNGLGLHFDYAYRSKGAWDEHFFSLGVAR